jgi:hypothetical protein
LGIVVAEGVSEKWLLVEDDEEVHRDEEESCVKETDTEPAEQHRANRRHAIADRGSRHQPLGCVPTGGRAGSAVRLAE